MQLGDFMCYALLTIAVATTCVIGEEDTHKHELEEKKTRKISKRDAALFIDNFPYEPIYNHKPKVIFRRISRQRYSPSKPKYGPPKPKYGPPPSKRKPAKKYRKQLSSKYGPPPKPRSPKPRYGPPKRSKKPVYGPPKKPHSPIPQYYTPEPAGFAEPPVDYEYPPYKQNYAEPPVDSYGAPLKTTNEPYPTAPNYYENANQFEHNEHPNIGQEYQSWQNHQGESGQDNTYAYSKKRPLFIQPGEFFDVQVNQDDDDVNVNPYSDFSYHSYKEPQYLHNRKKKPQFFADPNKKVNKYWKSPKLRPDNVKVETDDEILVGGQYAEPPARYVPKFQPSAPMYNGGDDFAPPQSFADSEGAATSATISPYVNYKNSNMAFSPQNLNDAFSIVDK